MTRNTAIHKIQTSLSILALCACLTGCRSPEGSHAEFNFAHSSFSALPDGGLPVKTPYTDYLLRDEFHFRTLYMVQPNGDLWVSSRINLYNPANLVVPYMKYMMAANLLVPDAQRALLVGVGGGSMIHFLQLHEPTLRVDGVDIDPEVIALAQNWFGISESESVALHPADGIQFMRDAEEAAYDIIYLDAFIRPNDDTDHAGIPLHLKTQSFYAKVEKNSVAPRRGGVQPASRQPNRNRHCSDQGHLCERVGAGCSRHHQCNRTGCEGCAS